MAPARGGYFARRAELCSALGEVEQCQDGIFQRTTWSRAVGRMWCKKCGQDVPGISSPASGGLCCARCGAKSTPGASPGVAAAGLAQSAKHGLDLGALSGAASTSFEDWSLDQSVRGLQARVGMGRRTKKRAMKPRYRRERRTRLRVDDRQSPVNAPHKHKSRRDVGSSLLAWSLMSLGLMSFVCGAVLVGWSIIDDRPDLWNIGLPAAAAGQVGLLMGLVLQLERVWQNSRYAVRKLDQVDSQLNSLERATNMLGMTHSSASQAFYAHMADQSNPQLLLADLKGQLDLLAMNIAYRD